MPRAVRKARPSRSGQLGLALTQPGDRITALGHERARLLKEIARRRKELARVANEIEAATAEAQAVVGPLLEQARSVERELHALFASLLAPGRMAKRKRAQVRSVYLSLQQAGLIGPNLADAPDHGARSGDEGAYGDVFDGGFADGRLPADEPAGRSASKPTDDGKHRMLRTLFKRLVVALHPDRTVHEDEKARRTATMKAVTRAYELGDLARMIELGDLLSGGSSLGRSLDEPALIVETLERTVVELKAQLRELLDELRRLRRSEPFRAAKDLERFRRVGADPFALLKVEEQARLDDLVAARDFVFAFETGKMGLREFLEGPTFPSDLAEAQADAIGDILDRVLDGIDIDLDPRRRRRGRADPIPF